MHCMWLICLHYFRQNEIDLKFQDRNGHVCNDYDCFICTAVYVTAVFVTTVCLTALNTMAVFEAAVSALYETECTQLQCSR